MILLMETIKGYNSFDSRILIRGLPYIERYIENISVSTSVDHHMTSHIFILSYVNNPKYESMDNFQIDFAYQKQYSYGTSCCSNDTYPVCSWDKTDNFTVNRSKYALFVEKDYYKLVFQVLNKLYDENYEIGFLLFSVTDNLENNKFIDSHASLLSTIAIIGIFENYSRTIYDIAKKYSIPIIHPEQWEGDLCDPIIYNMGFSKFQLLYQSIYSFNSPGIYYVSEYGSPELDNGFLYVSDIYKSLGHDISTLHFSCFSSFRDYSSFFADILLNLQSGGYIYFYITRVSDDFYTFLHDFHLPPNYVFVFFKQFEGATPLWEKLENHYLVSSLYLELFDLSYVGFQEKVEKGISNQYYSILLIYDILNILILSTKEYDSTNKRITLNNIEYSSVYEDLVTINRNNQLNRPIGVYQIQKNSKLKEISFFKEIQTRMYSSNLTYCDVKTPPYIFTHDIAYIGIIYDSCIASLDEKRFLEIATFTLDYLSRTTVLNLLFSPKFCITTEEKLFINCISTFIDDGITMIISQVSANEISNNIKIINENKVIVYYLGIPQLPLICSKHL